MNIKEDLKIMADELIEHIKLSTSLLADKMLKGAECCEEHIDNAFSELYDKTEDLQDQVHAYAKKLEEK